MITRLVVALAIALAVPAPALGATVTFDGSTDQDWNTPANWDTNAVPGPADDAVIPSARIVTLTSGADASVDSLDLQGTLTVSGRTLTLGAGTSTIANNLTVNQSGALLLNGETNWTAGLLAAGGFMNTATVVNDGQLDVTGDGGGVQAADNGSTSFIHNTGTINFLGPGDETWSIGVDNDGALTVVDGTLSLIRGSAGETSTGSFTVADGATLGLGGFPASHLLGGTAVVSGPGTVLYDSDVVSIAAGATYSPGATLLSGGTLELAGTGTTGTFQSDGTGGTRQGAGTLTVGGGAASALNGIAFAGGGSTVFAAGHTVAATGSVGVRGGTTVRLNGTTNMSAGAWTFGSFGEPDAVLENAGTLNLTGDVVLSHGGGAVGRVSNLAAGTINRTTSSGTATLNLPLDNDGTVDVATGTLQLTSGTGGTSSGDYVADPGATIAFGGAVDGAIGGAGSSVSGGGTVRFDLATVALAANTTYSPGTTVISGGFVSLAGPGSTGAFVSDGEGGGRDGAGILTVTGPGSNLNTVTFRGGGTTAFPAGQTLPVTGNVQIQGSTTVRLNGTTNLSSGTWSLGSFGEPAAVIENGGTLNIPGDVTLSHGGGAVGRMHNLPGGTINRTTSAATATLNLPLDNDGTVDVQTGTLQLSDGTGPGATSSGDYDVDAGAVLAFGGGSNASIGGSGASVGGDGTVRFDLGTTAVAADVTYDPATTLVSGGALSLAGAGTTGAFQTDGSGASVRTGGGTLTVGGGSSNLDGISFEGGGTTVFPAGATLAATGSVQVRGNTTVRLNGTTAWSGGQWSFGDFAQPPGVLENAGTLNATSGADMTDGGGATGLVRNLAGGTINRTTASDVVVMPELQNAGTINVDGGTLAPRVMSQSAGTTDLAAGTTLQSITVTLDGGTLGGPATVDANLVNNGGTVNPGASPGILTVDGSYTQSAGGTLRAEIAGATAGTQYDQLAVTGNASLGGTLAIVTAPAFDPDPADDFDVVTSGGDLSGAFATLTGAQFGGGTYDVFYTAGPPGRATLALALPAPSNTTPPSLPASAVVGDTVTCNPGTWTGSPTFEFQWLRDGVPVATGGSYTITDADAGRSIVCRVTATNGGGSDSADSGSLVPTAQQPPPPPAPPVNTTPPSLPASAEAGQTVTCNPGEWTGAPAFAYVWLRDGVVIDGETSDTYRLAAADAGARIVCRVTATNADGGASADSAPLVPALRTETIRGEEAFTEGTANDLYLACTRLDLWLIDVLPRGARRIRVTGAADLRLVGETVRIFLGQRGPGTRVGSARVQPDGSFATTVAAPRGARARKAARYQARSGSARSQRLRLVRRMVATALTREGDGLELTGVLLRPFTRPPAVIEVERYLSCRRREKVDVVPVRPNRRGRFTVDVPLPDGPPAVLYRARTRAPTTTTGRVANVFTLPRALDLP